MSLQQKRQSRRVPALIILACIALMDVIAFYALPLDILYPPGQFKNDAAPMEAAAILFNDFNKDFTGINNESKRRVNEGLLLLKTGKVKQLIVAGGNREKKASGAEFMAAYLRERGVPASQILLEANSKDTSSNLQQIGRMLTGTNITAITLVSSPYHLLRIRSLGMNIPAITDIQYHPYDPANSIPPITRNEIWFSAHYNGLAYIANVLLPQTLYRKIVIWIRENTKW